MAGQDDRAAVAARIQHRFEIPREPLKTVAAVRWLAGQAEAREIPQDKAEAVGKVLAEAKVRGVLK